MPRMSKNDWQFRLAEKLTKPLGRIPQRPKRIPKRTPGELILPDLTALTDAGITPIEGWCKPKGQSDAVDR